MSVVLGFKFRPTKKELINNFLKPKIMGFDSIVDALVATVDLYKSEPVDLPEKSKVADEKKWYYLCRREKIGGRFKRKTKLGFWKSTCTEKKIFDKDNGECIAKRRTLVYYTGTSRGRRTNWIIHEYSLSNQSDDSYVICRLKEKKLKIKKIENKADFAESLDTESSNDIAFGEFPYPREENGLADHWNHELLSQSPELRYLDGIDTIDNVKSAAEVQLVNDKSSIIQPMVNPYPFDTSDVSPTELSKFLFTSLDENFCGILQNFHSLSEIRMANLPQSTVIRSDLNTGVVDGGLYNSVHQFFGSFPNSS